MQTIAKKAPFVFADKLDMEMVERKGIGHPDTICDQIAELTSRLFSRYCLEQHNAIAHHWFDKVMLIGGTATIEFGFGRLDAPFSVIFVGKAPAEICGIKVPLEALARAAAEEVLQKILREFDCDKNLQVELRLGDGRGPGNRLNRYTPVIKSDLVELGATELRSNDCCVCTAFAPLSPLEQLVYQLEKRLSSKHYRHDNGSDVKIVAVRHGQDVDLLINVPLIAKYVASSEAYRTAIAEIRVDVEAWLAAEFAAFAVCTTINPAERDYLTVTGTVADTGDVGVVGRGNRANGLITPMRPMSIEAAAGKNPADHSGKLYTIVSQDIASRIWEEVGLANQVYISTAKDLPIDSPANVLVYLETAATPEQLAAIDDILRQQIQGVYQLLDDVIQGDRPLW